MQLSKNPANLTTFQTLCSNMTSEVVFLHDLKYEDLQNLVKLIYEGEIEMTSKDQLTGLQSAAGRLGITITSKKLIDLTQRLNDNTENQPPASKPYQIFVKTINDRTIVILVENQEEPIRDIKHKVAGKTGVPMGMFNLWFGSKFCDANKSVQACNISQLATLSMTMSSNSVINIA